MAGLRFPQTSAEDREKTFYIEQQQRIVGKQGCSMIFKDHLKGENWNFEEFDHIKLHEI